MAAMVLPNHKSISRRATRPPPPAVMLAAPLPWDQPYSHRTQLALLPPTEALRSAFPLNYTMEKEQRRHINEQNRMPSAISQRKPLNIQPQATAMLAPHRHRTGTDVVKPNRVLMVICVISTIILYSDYRNLLKTFSSDNAIKRKIVCLIA